MGNAMKHKRDQANKELSEREKLCESIRKSKKEVPIEIVEIIICFLETRNIFLCSHKGTDLNAYNVHGDFLGSVMSDKAKRQAEGQWITGFDFDSAGALYVAMYNGFAAKYPVPSSGPFIQKRVRDKTFAQNIKKATHKYHRAKPTVHPEGVVVVENENHSSVFITAMAPLDGILQLSLEGVLQRKICLNSIMIAWSLHRVPTASNERAILMVASRNMLKVIDPNAGDCGKVLHEREFKAHDNSEPCDYIGDFTFQENDGTRRLVINLQNGVFQCADPETLELLEGQSTDLNVDGCSDCRRVSTKCSGVCGDVLAKKIEDSYGTSIGPDGLVYLCDNDNHRIVKFNLDDDHVHVSTFVTDVRRPNYSLWYSCSFIN